MQLTPPSSALVLNGASVSERVRGMLLLIVLLRQESEESGLYRPVADAGLAVNEFLSQLQDCGQLKWRNWLAWFDSERDALDFRL